EHPLGVGGFELRVQIHLTVDRVDEPVQTLAGVRVPAIGVDDENVVFGQSLQRNASRFVIPWHIDVAPVESGATDRVGGDVDVGVGSGQRVELDCRHRAEGALAWLTIAVGEVERDAITVDGDTGRAFDGLFAGQIGKCHASNLSADAYAVLLTEGVQEV